MTLHHHDDTPFLPVSPGTERRVVAYNDQLMAVEVRFAAGAVGAVHTHPHTQCSYVLSGSFRYTVAGEETLLETGDSIVVPSGEPHGTVCVEAGVLLDIFTPCREDFLPPVAKQSAEVDTK